MHGNMQDHELLSPCHTKEEINERIIEFLCKQIHASLTLHHSTKSRQKGPITYHTNNQVEQIQFLALRGCRPQLIEIQWIGSEWVLMPFVRT